MKDIELYSKTNNFGDGNLDWGIADGITQYEEDRDAVCQAVMKATIASIDPVTGYGVNVRELRGQKDEVAFRGTLVMRLLLTLAVLEKYYGTSFDVELIEVERGKDYINILCRLSIGEVRIKIGE